MREGSITTQPTMTPDASATTTVFEFALNRTPFIASRYRY
jgi:hypothetical protein